MKNSAMRSATALLIMALTCPSGLAAQPGAGKSVKNAFDFTGSIGFTQTRGNASADNINVGNTLVYKVGGWVFKEDLAFLYREANKQVNTSFWNGGLRGDRNIAGRIALFLASRYDRNQPQGVLNRYQQGFGMSIRAMDDEHNKLSVALGGSLFSQELSPGVVAKVSRAFPAARAAVDYRYQFSSRAWMQHSAEYLPAVGDTASSFFFNTESSLVAPITENVGVRLGYILRYNSEPPLKGEQQLRTTDIFFSSGLTVTF